MSGRGPWLQTYTGKAFYPLAPAPEDVDIEDIAHSLSNQCRFAGHTRVFYSVAEHCVRCARFVIDQVADERAAWALAALLHDASEAYLVDLPRPLKAYSDMGDLYSEIETGVQRVVGKAFGVDPAKAHAGLIKLADDTLLATEKRDLMSAAPMVWHPLPEPMADRIEPWTPAVAREAFLAAFDSAYIRVASASAPSIPAAPADDADDTIPRLSLSDIYEGRT